MLHLADPGCIGVPVVTMLPRPLLTLKEQKRERKKAVLRNQMRKRKKPMLGMLGVVLLAVLAVSFTGAQALLVREETKTLAEVHKHFRLKQLG